MAETVIAGAPPVVTTPTVQVVGTPAIAQPSFWRKATMWIAGTAVTLQPFAQEFLPGSWKYTGLIIAGLALLARANTHNVVADPNAGTP